jgi:hypothetical protein
MRLRNTVSKLQTLKKSLSVIVKKYFFYSVNKFLSVFFSNASYKPSTHNPIVGLNDQTTDFRRARSFRLDKQNLKVLSNKN